MATPPLDREPIPAWVTPAEGFTAEEFLALPDLPRHTELIDGGLVFVAPQRNFHMAMIDFLTHEFRRQVPAGVRATREMAVRIGDRTVLEPDILLIRADQTPDPTRTIYQPSELVLAIEVTSPDSAERDRDTKPHKYARVGIPHYWRVEESDFRPVIYTYRLDPTTRAYVITGIHHDQFQVAEPIEFVAELSGVEQYYG